jgi:hypothetical protein
MWLNTTGLNGLFIVAFGKFRGFLGKSSNPYFALGPFAFQVIETESKSNRNISWR